jgi:CRISPR system Cascade subunit CasD
VSRRYYLADAVFAVAVSGPDDMIDAVAAALKAPVWASYLGRRACPPDEPLFLCGPVADPESMLERLPLARRRPEEDTVTVDFVYERTPTETNVPANGRLELADVPESFATDRRRYRTRTLYVVPRSLPAKLCAGYEHDGKKDDGKKNDNGESDDRFRDKYLIRLTEYLQEFPR